jgi:hypothetical protein
MTKYKLNSVIDTAILYEIREEDKNKSCIYLIAVFYKQKWRLKYGWCFNFLKHIKLLNKELHLNCEELYTKKYYIPKIIPLVILWTNSIDTIIDFEYKFPPIMRDNNLTCRSQLKNSLKFDYTVYDKFLQYGTEHDIHNTWESDIYVFNDSNQLIFKNCL